MLPSKIFEYLGMERPILLGVGGEARKVVEDSGGGEYVAFGDGLGVDEFEGGFLETDFALGNGFAELHGLV